MKLVIVLVVSLSAAVVANTSIFQSNESYCKDLVARAGTEAVLKYLRGWALTIRIHGKLKPTQVVETVGIRPGSAKLAANVSWGIFGWENAIIDPELRIVLGELGSYAPENIKFLFFAERSRYGYLVKVAEDSSFDDWSQSDMTLIEDDIAVLCIK